MTPLQSPTLVGKVAVSEEVLPRRGGARVLTDTELVDGGWEPILTMETWRRVCETLNTPGRRTNSGNQLRHPLIPIARCNCGASMRHHVEKWKVKSGEARSMNRLLCTDQQCLTGIGYDAVEESVTAAVLELLDRGGWDALRTSSRADKKAAVTEAADRLARMWELVLSGSVEVEEYAEAKARWATIEDQVGDDAETVELPDLADIRQAWPDLSARERLLVYRAAIKTLTIKPATRRGGRGVDLDRIDIDWAI